MCGNFKRNGVFGTAYRSSGHRLEYRELYSGKYAEFRRSESGRLYRRSADSCAACTVRGNFHNCRSYRYFAFILRFPGSKRNDDSPDGHTLYDKVSAPACSVYGNFYFGSSFGGGVFFSQKDNKNRTDNGNASGYRYTQFQEKSCAA